MIVSEVLAGRWHLGHPRLGRSAPLWPGYLVWANDGDLVERGALRSEIDGNQHMCVDEPKCHVYVWKVVQGWAKCCWRRLSYCRDRVVATC